MRAIPNVRIERHRIGGPPATRYGEFQIGALRVRISAGGGWDHVSVSRQDRAPTWGEMNQIKRSCFRDDEIVMQLHVDDGRKVNLHPYCLHLWRPQTEAELEAERLEWVAAGEAWPYDGVRAPGAIPMPPGDFV